MKRILSIDGGGIKGVFPASFLAEIEDSVDYAIAEYFDLIVGTSTGGIIAIGLGLGIPAREILGLYEDLGPEVFGGNGFLNAMRHLFAPKYSSRALRISLEKTLGDRKLGESITRLVIPSLDLETGNTYLYKTAHHPRFRMDYKVPAVDVALATASAPTYFLPHKTVQGLPLIDGGLWANNPTGVAVVEALGVLEWPKEEIMVLSLGCTTPPLDVKRSVQDGGGLKWGLPAIEIFMTAQSSASLGTAYTLLSHDQVKRICPFVPPGRFSLDGIDAIADLKGKGHTEARHQQPLLKDIFFNDKKEPFEPCHLAA